MIPMRTETRVRLGAALVFATTGCSSTTSETCKVGCPPASGVDASAPDASDAADTGSSGTKTFPTSKFLFAFHACDRATTDCGSPQNHRVHFASTDDGVTFTRLSGKGVEGSVPDIIRRDDTIYAYTPGMVMRWVDGSTEPAAAGPIKVNGLSGGFVDPSLTIDSQGRLVLFGMGSDATPGDPAGCKGATSCSKSFISATEVSGTDGAEFTLDPGDRVTLTVASNGAAGTYPSASDPDIFYDGTRYILYISHGTTTTSWTSSTLLGSYAQIKQPNGERLTRAGGIACGYYDAASKKYWTYVHIQENGKSVIKRAVHDSIDTEINASSFTTVMSGASIGLGESFNVESPSIAVNVP